MPVRVADRNLLFGILALQMDLITRDALVAAMGTWVLGKHRSLGEILVEAGALDPGDRADLEPMIARRIAREGGDPARSLAALTSVEVIATEIRRSIADAEVLASIDTVELNRSEDPFLTRAASLRTIQVDPPRTQDFYATQVVGSTAISSAGPTSGRTSGSRYRKVRKHAAGNLGVVYVARDEELNRDVALKEIKERNADHPYNQAKFLLEAEVTGGLEHPGIVPVYGLGHHDDGRPFYAMRFIRGESLLDAIRKFHADESLKTDPGRRTLALQKILRRFTDVCNAIAYAHSRGVLHRDLKPDNVMVGRYGETLVVDWGLAKTFGQSESAGAGADQDDRWPEGSLQPSTSGDVEATLYGSVVGTPAFMSPEQARGDTDGIGPRSDVYSLGATLYFLLTDRVPFEGGDVQGVLGRVQAGDFPPPRALEPSIDRALEAVCLKAMATVPDGRYASCRMLAEDVERWAADEPVTAWREPISRRAGRWAIRNKTKVTVAAALLIAGSAGLAASNVLVNRQKARAELEFRRARRAVDESFVVVSENTLLDVPGMQPLRKQLLGSARKYYREFLKDRADDPTLKVDLARTQLRLGKIAASLDERPEALESFRSAAAIYEALEVSEPNVWQHRLDRAIAIDRRGMLLLDEAGRLDDAEKALDQAQALFASLARDHPHDWKIQSFLAGSYGNLGTVAQKRGDAKTAGALFQQSLDRQRALLQEHPDETDLLSDLALAEWSHASFTLLQGQREEATKGYERTVKFYERLVEKQPWRPSIRLDLASALQDLGRIYFDQGGAEAGRGPAERGLAIDQELVNESPRVGEYRGNLAMAHNMMSDMDRASGRIQEAGKHAKAASDLLEVLVREVPRSIVYRVGLSKASNVLGRTAVAEGRLDDARRAFAHAVEVIEALPEPAPVDLYNLACHEALTVPLMKADEREGQVRRATAAIKRAIKAGFASGDFYRRDSDFDSLRGEPAFQQILRDLTSP